jgi:hypothetical protein
LRLKQTYFKPPFSFSSPSLSAAFYLSVLLLPRYEVLPSFSHFLFFCLFFLPFSSSVLLFLSSILLILSNSFVFSSLSLSLYLLLFLLISYPFPFFLSACMAFFLPLFNIPLCLCVCLPVCLFAYLSVSLTLFFSLQFSLSPFSLSLSLFLQCKIINQEAELRLLIG